MALLFQPLNNHKHQQLISSSTCTVKNTCERNSRHVKIFFFCDFFYEKVVARLQIHGLFYWIFKQWIYQVPTWYFVFRQYFRVLQSFTCGKIIMRKWVSGNNFAQLSCRIQSHWENVCVIQLGKNFSLEGLLNDIQFPQTWKPKLMLFIFNVISWGKEAIFYYRLCFTLVKRPYTYLHNVFY